MISRIVLPNEVPMLTKLGELFFAESNQPGVFNHETFIRHWKTVIHAGIGFILAGWVGDYQSDPDAAIGGMVYPDPNTGDLVAAEAFYYAQLCARGRGAIRLIEEFERQCKAAGAGYVMMACLGNPDAERFDRWYLRRGYVRRETFYGKRI